MSLGRVITALVGLWFSRTDAEVCIYLAKKGPLTIEPLEKFLNSNKK